MKTLRQFADFFVSIAAAGIVAASVPAAAQTPAEFYKDRTVTIVLGHPPGGSYHMYATLAANHLKRHIPGHPNIIIEHRPGGGGVRAMRHFYSNSPRDGSVMALFAEAIAHTEFLQPEVGQWRTLEMTYIGSFSGVGAVMMRRENAPAKTIAEMRKIQSSVGCSGKAMQPYQTPALMKNLGGFNFRIVCGYPGSAEFVMAMQRGEVDMVASVWLQWRTSHTDEIAKGSMVPVVQTGLRRNRELPDLPLMQEVIDDPTSKRVIEFWSANTAIGRALMVPPRVPADRIAALRVAFDSRCEGSGFPQRRRARQGADRSDVGRRGPARRARDLRRAEGYRGEGQACDGLIAAAPTRTPYVIGSAKPNHAPFRDPESRAPALDDPLIFNDPIVIGLVPEASEPAIRNTLDDVGAPDPKLLRYMFAMRSRFAEDRLAQAAARGVRQYVMVGAGLDTFPWRQPDFAKTMQIFAADHPASLAWTNGRLRQHGLSRPSNLTYVPVNLEERRLGDQLLACGFEARRQASARYWV